MSIPFNKPYLTGLEKDYVNHAIDERHLLGNGSFSKRCHAWLENNLGTGKALLTGSGTTALEMAALLTGVHPGDEVIMPSFTFVSTANAYVLRGAVPVFVDIRPDTLNIDEQKIEAAITPKTKAIVVVHYAGVACEMDSIVEIARRHGLLLVEDAAQAILGRYKNRQLGTIGDFAALSFHGTKNLVAGEGGAILVNEPKYYERAEIVWEKGTNRSKFFRGLVDKYTWVDLGSSYLLGELPAAFLAAQLENADRITELRMEIWNRYHQAFASLEAQGRVRRPHIPVGIEHNAHTYYLLLPNLEIRTQFIKGMGERGIGCAFHYVPLHSSPAGQQYARTAGDLSLTTSLSEQLVRLPLWAGMSSEEVDTVIRETKSLL